MKITCGPNYDERFRDCNTAEVDAEYGLFLSRELMEDARLEQEYLREESKRTAEQNEQILFDNLCNIRWEGQKGIATVEEARETPISGTLTLRQSNGRTILTCGYAGATGEEYDLAKQRMLDFLLDHHWSPLND